MQQQLFFCQLDQTRVMYKLLIVAAMILSFGAFVVVTKVTKAKPRTVAFGLIGFGVVGIIPLLLVQYGVFDLPGPTMQIGMLALLIVSTGAMLMGTKILVKLGRVDRAAAGQAGNTKT